MQFVDLANQFSSEIRVIKEGDEPVTADGKSVMQMIVLEAVQGTSLKIQADGDDADRVQELCGLLGHERAVAVGETGLDFFRDYAPRDAQRRLFERHLTVAADLGKPVVVHTRAADDETSSALEDFGGTVVLHCFSSPALLPVALERGYYVSFAGNVTFPKAPELREAAAAVPGDRILAETDSPYLAPQPRRGRPNEPAFVVHTIEALAAARGEDPAVLAERIDANATAAFSLP